MWKAIAVVALAACVYAQTQNDPVIEAARKAAAVYAQSLPDYMVSRSTSRYRSTPKSTVQTTVDNTRGAVQPTRADAGAEISGWQQIDTITGVVTVQRGREIYTNIRVNGSPANYLPPGGSWSAGEFAGEIPMIFSPESAAVFSHPHVENLRNHAAVRYNFAVDQSHSTWNMAAANNGSWSSNLNYSPAYTGRIWIDKETGQAISIEMTAKELPRGFPVWSVESRTDYDFVKIGDGKFLLPIGSQTTSCEPGGNVCLKNETEFKDFRKFESSSSLTFDGPAKQ
jgi:hypothetical protein